MRAPSRRKHHPSPFRLKDFREALGVTQDQLGDRTKLGQSRLSKVEKSPNIRLSTLRRYVTALGATLEISAITARGDRHLLFTDQAEPHHPSRRRA